MPKTNGLFTADTTIPATPSPEATDLVYPVPVKAVPTFFSPYRENATKMADLRHSLRAEVEMLMQNNGDDYQTALKAQYNIEAALLRYRGIFSPEFIGEVNIRLSILQELYVRAFFGMIEDTRPAEPRDEAGPSALRI